jgi:hypothetical protein
MTSYHSMFMTKYKLNKFPTIHFRKSAIMCPTYEYTSEYAGQSVYLLLRVDIQLSSYFREMTQMKVL